MPRREWTPKNQLKSHAKRPEAVYAAIRKQYCKGRSYAETTAIVSRWARARGLKSVSRQTVSKHYADAGERLWFALYLDHHGTPPPLGLTPQEDENHVRKYVYLSRQQYIEDRDFFQKECANKPYMKALMPWLSEAPLSGHKRLFENILINVLRATSQRFRGLPEGTFYIQYARAYWLEKFLISHPNLSVRICANMIFEKLQATEEDFTLAEKRQQAECDPKFFVPVSYKYYLLGRNLVQVGMNVYGDSIQASQYDKTKRKLVRNDESVLKITLGDPDDLENISEGEFFKRTGLRA